MSVLTLASWYCQAHTIRVSATIHNIDYVARRFYQIGLRVVELHWEGSATNRATSSSVEYLPRPPNLLPSPSLQVDLTIPMSLGFLGANVLSLLTDDAIIASWNNEVSAPHLLNSCSQTFDPLNSWSQTPHPLNSRSQTPDLLNSSPSLLLPSPIPCSVRACRVTPCPSRTPRS